MAKQKSPACKGAGLKATEIRIATGAIVLVKVFFIQNRFKNRGDGAVAPGTCIILLILNLLSEIGAGKKGVK